MANKKGIYWCKTDSLTIVFNEGFFSRNKWLHIHCVLIGGSRPFLEQCVFVASWIAYSFPSCRRPFSCLWPSMPYLSLEAYDARDIMPWCEGILDFQCYWYILLSSIHNSYWCMCTCFWFVFFVNYHWYVERLDPSI